jgi:NADPH2:quinone reductase
MTGLTIRTAAGFRAGESVLIQGATGVSGRLAVKIARLLDAGRIVVTGRDDAALREVLELGADEAINTAVPEAELQAAYAANRCDVVLDFLWGRPTEILLQALVPTSFGLSEPVRLVQVGESAGTSLTLKGEMLRTSGVEIYGAGRGFTETNVAEVYQQVVDWTRSGALTFDVERVPLSDVEAAWQRTDLRGRRLVVTP